MTSEIARHREFFNREGYVHLPGVLSAAEVAALKNRIDAAFEDPACQTEDRRYAEISMVRMFELDPVFRDLLVREPSDPSAPEFEGRGAHSMLCSAGDAYLQHGQVWHRGAPNNSDRTRCLLQQCYAARHISQRFYPFLNYAMPETVLEGADERMLRVLGKHPKGCLRLDLRTGIEETHSACTSQLMRQW